MLGVMGQITEACEWARAYLRSLAPGRMRADAVLLGPEEARRHERQSLALHERADAMGVALARAATGLREAGTALVNAVAAPGTQELWANAIKDQLKQLRLRIASEEAVWELLRAEHQIKLNQRIFLTG